MRFDVDLHEGHICNLCSLIVESCINDYTNSQLSKINLHKTEEEFYS